MIWTLSMEEALFGGLHIGILLSSSQLCKTAALNRLSKEGVRERGRQRKIEAER